MPRVEQSFAHMRPDKPSATCDQKIHRSGCYVSELAQVEMRLESNGHAKCRRDLAFEYGWFIVVYIMRGSLPQRPRNFAFGWIIMRALPDSALKTTALG